MTNTRKFINIAILAITFPIGLFFGLPGVVIWFLAALGTLPMLK